MAGKILVAAALSASTASAAEANPIGKTIQLLEDLEAKILAEGKEAQKLYEEFSEFCEERSANLQFELKTAKGQKVDDEAVIAEQAARIDSLDENIGSLAGDIAKDEKDLKAATGIRAKERADFDGEEKELMETIDTLERAVGILEKHASLLQTKNAGNVAQALTMLVQAEAMSTADAKQLTALVQDGEEDANAPAATVYEGHSGDIVATLNGLLEKAQDQLADLRKAETNNIHNFELLQQSLEDSIKVGDKNMAKAKKNKAASSEERAAAQGDLAQAEKLIASDTTALTDLHKECLTKAQAYEAEYKSRGEEMKALGEAKKIISEGTGAAETAQYGLAQVPTFVQESGSSKYEAVRFVRSLAQREKSSALAQLAMRMASVMHARTHSGADQFGKVKGLISDMITKLEAEAEADATHKAYCDKELKETKVKQADKNAEIEKLSTKIDGMAARSAALKAEVADLEKALRELAVAQVEMDKLRQAENEAYVKNKADMEEGINAVKRALKVLRDYYGGDDKAHAAAEGSANGIIGLLEVVESDFESGLAEMTSTEEAAAAAYDQETKENEIEKAAKEQDAKYKKEESTGLDKSIQEASSDRQGVQTELAAVMDYLKSLEKECIEKAETYEERKRRFEAELAGLRQALQILNGEAMLVQDGAVRRSLRAVRPHA